MKASTDKLQKKLEREAAKILKSLKIKNAASVKAEIFLLNEKKMTVLKKKFLPKNEGPANVLSFAEPRGWPGSQKQKSLGEIYLNFDLTGGDFKELRRLLVHGILHLSGYDHERKSDRIKMEKLEKKLT